MQPVIESIHLVGVALLVGTIALVDLRLLGLGLRHLKPVSVAATLAPWTWAGALTVLITGPLLFWMDSTRYLKNPAVSFEDGPAGRRGCHSLHNSPLPCRTRKARRGGVACVVELCGAGRPGDRGLRCLLIRSIRSIRGLFCLRESKPDHQPLDMGIPHRERASCARHGSVWRDRACHRSAPSGSHDRITGLAMDRLHGRGTHGSASVRLQPRPLLGQRLLPTENVAADPAGRQCRCSFRGRGLPHISR